MVKRTMILTGLFALATNHANAQDATAPEADAPEAAAPEAASPPAEEAPVAEAAPLPAPAPAPAAAPTAAAPAPEPEPMMAEPAPEPLEEPAAASTGGSVALSTSDGASASGGFAEYNEKYKPEAGLWEVGHFVGLMFPADDHNMYASRLEQQPYAGTALALGGRVAYFPLTFVGLELEGEIIPTEVEDGTSAALYAGRGSIIAQLPGMSLTPFLMIGGGWLGGISESMGNDADPAFQFGLGLKAPLGHLISARLDLRDTMTQKFNASDGDQTHHPEVLLGLTVNIERTRPKPPPPPADSDGDGVPDSTDQCPKDGALTADGCPLDSDGDGVPDRDDYCPREKGDQPDGCLAPDEDGDGVHRLCDKCPTEKGIEPDGCPLRDSDGDGLFDDVDRCPKDPETKNGFEDKDGCPDEVPEEVKEYTGSIEGIYFARNKATIRERSFKMLDAAVAVLQKFESIRIEISGHTSSEGDAERNKELSLERANAVKTYLLEKGVSPERVVARGAGPDEPIADNKTAAGRKKNRRIEFKILSQ